MKNVYINSENNSLEKINHKNGSAFNEIRIIICLKQNLNKKSTGDFLRNKIKLSSLIKL